MKISDVTAAIETVAHTSLQEDYDNSGLLVGSPYSECSGILCTLDVTEAVIDEASERGCNLVVAHHPIIFRPMKRITGASEPERVVIEAIKKDIAIYAAHTNLDNVERGVSARIAEIIGLKNRRVLQPKAGLLKKLFTFVPSANLDEVRNALFAAGAGNISNYSECSFTTDGTGTFLPGEGTKPYAGTPGVRQNEKEVKLEVILPAYAEKQVLKALFSAHPYEEVAYDVVNLANYHQSIGSGMIGSIDPIDEIEFLQLLMRFNPSVVRHTPLRGKKVSTVAVCGGAGSFLQGEALRAGADAYVTADLKYHEFFSPEGRMLLCDIGHFESEQFTTDLLVELLRWKFPNFAVLKSEVRTNPVFYFTGKK